MEATSLRFAAAARVLGHTARRRDWSVPGFRSPPRLADADRSLRRTNGGHVMIAIRLRGRPWMAVLSDMIEGVIATNQWGGTDADAARRVLWASLEGEGLLPPAPPAPPVRVAPTPTLPVRAVPARSSLVPSRPAAEAGRTQPSRAA